MLADLGGLLWWDDPHQARAALERAIAAGNQHALIDLAKLRHAVLNDIGAALLGYQQAAGSADPGVAAEALLELGHLEASRRMPRPPGPPTSRPSARGTPGGRHRR
jgi:hypothetical protein